MSKYTVCPNCEGEGYVGTLGVFTMDEFDEAFNGDADDYHRMHKVSQEHCKCCKGRRVVTAEDEAEWADECEYEAERAAERRAGC